MGRTGADRSDLDVYLVGAIAQLHRSSGSQRQLYARHIAAIAAFVAKHAIGNDVRGGQRMRFAIHFRRRDAR